MNYLHTSPLPPVWACLDLLIRQTAEPWPESLLLFMFLFNHIYCYQVYIVSVMLSLLLHRLTRATLPLL